MKWAWMVLLLAGCDNCQKAASDKWPNGNLKVVQQFDCDGLEHGTTTYYWENGNKQLEYQMIHGHASGYSRQFDETGKMTEEKEF